MKISEKLFNAINDMDESIINEAKPEEQKPVQIKIKKHLPIKEIALFAACFVVLAGAVFGIVKYRIDHDLQTAKNNSDSDSSVIDEIFTYDPALYETIYNGLKIPREITEEDKALQEVLADMRDGVEDIQTLFIYQKKNSTLPWDEYYCGSDKKWFCAYGDDDRTEPHGVFAIPHNYEEMRSLLLEYFTEETAEKYLSTVNSGSIIADDRAKYISLDDAKKGLTKFIFMDNRLYREHMLWEGISFGADQDPPVIPLKMCLECETAKVVKRTENTIYFTAIFSYFDNIFSLDKRPEYAHLFENAECSLVKERGGWKLNYCRAAESDEDTRNEFSFSAEDKELFDIVKPLSEDLEEVIGMFSDMHTYNDILRFTYEHDDPPPGYSGGRYAEYVYFRFTNEQRTEPNGKYALPQTYDELEKLLQSVLTPEAAKSYMRNAAKGTLIQGSDGGNQLRFDEGYTRDAYYRFIEIDGKLYCALSFSEREQEIDPYSVKLVSKTDRVIEFTYEHDDQNDDTEQVTQTGYLVNSGDGWRLNFYNEYDFLPPLDSDDKELQKTLEDLEPAMDIQDWVTHGKLNVPALNLRFVLPGSEYPTDYSLAESDAIINNNYKFPKTCEELEEFMLRYIPQSVAEDITEKYVCKGTMSENSDGSYSVTLDRENADPQFIEIDGRMYIRNNHVMYYTAPVWETARIISKTDSAITFSFRQALSGNNTLYGTVYYERGGWKLDPFFKDTINSETDHPEDKNDELREILKDILPYAVELDSMFHSFQSSGEKVLFVNDRNGDQAYYCPITGDMRTQPGGRFKMPQSRAELEELMSRYFTKRAVISFMNGYGKGGMTANPDGSYSVTTDKEILTPFIEIDGQLYCRANIDYIQPLNFDPETASVLSHTDTVFTFSHENSWFGNGTIVYEDGSWKLNYFYDNGFYAGYPAEFSAEDEELQKILNELSPAEDLTYWFGGVTYPKDKIRLIFEGSKTAGSIYYVKLSEYVTYSSFGGVEEYPRTYEELHQMMLRYLTQEKAEQYMKYAAKGTITGVSNGDYHIKTESLAYVYPPRLIELDGELYVYIVSNTNRNSADWNSAKVISKTDDTIEFSYYGAGINGSLKKGTLKFERGGWRLSSFYDPFQAD